MAEKRNGSSEPMTPAPTMMSAVLASGGNTRHGMVGAPERVAAAGEPIMSPIFRANEPPWRR
jgi:hypothetical protein